MSSNVDNRPGGGTGGMTPRFHYTAQVSFVSATFIAAAQTPYAPNTILGFGGQQVAATQPTLNVVPNAAGTYNFNIGAIPYGSRILRATAINGVVWAGATVNVALGVASGGVTLAASQTNAAFAATLAVPTALTLVASAVEYVETQEFVPIWASIIISAGTLTSGQSDIVIEYATTHGPQGQF